MFWGLFPSFIAYIRGASFTSELDVIVSAELSSNFTCKSPISFSNFLESYIVSNPSETTEECRLPLSELFLWALLLLYGVIDPLFPEFFLARGERPFIIDGEAMFLAGDRFPKLFGVPVDWPLR